MGVSPGGRDSLRAKIGAVRAQVDGYKIILTPQTSKLSPVKNVSVEAFTDEKELLIDGLIAGERYSVKIHTFVGDTLSGAIKYIGVVGACIAT